jgi:hypothetical protein
MKTSGGWLLAAALFAVALSLSDPRAFAQTVAARANVTVKWDAQPVINFTLTPNYYSGFGQVAATIGTQPAPTHGPDASLDGGSVDFGNVYAGSSYLYKYAAALSVTTNDPAGFNVYGEGAADFFNTADSSTVPIAQSIYYLSSTSGSPADTNTGFSAATPFQKTGGLVNGNGEFTAPTITYTVYPAPVVSSTTASSKYYYDYQLKVPPAATSGLYYVWIVYTVVAR